jgi:hypothetical protein
MGKHVTHHKKIKRSSAYCDNKGKMKLVVTEQISPKLYKRVSDFVDWAFVIALLALALYLNIKF